MEKRLDVHNSDVPRLCRSCEVRHRGICGALKPDELLAARRTEPVWGICYHIILINRRQRSLMQR